MNLQTFGGGSLQLETVGLAHAQSLQSEAHTHKSINYRPDIDGLRTIAITLVIIYHAWPKQLPGGFIGVDIFFVISGYLISQIIIKQSNKGKFSYVDFYCRRVKRIFPALLIVLTFTLFIAARYSQKDQAKLTFNTLDASALFGANIQILFYNQGYFDPDIRMNPLLHLWSLGVEQQFYIFWPWLMIIALKFWKNKTVLILGAFAGFSFMLSIISVLIDPKFAFYFPVCRFWQMAVGGIMAYLNITVKDKFVNNLLSISAIVAILVNVFIMSDRSLFPGFWALIPTFSSAFIIQAKSQAFINKHILSSNLFVSIGKISYSLYLWHWPLLVFSRTFCPPGSTSIFGNTFFIIFMTFVLTILTYFLAEDPIRKKKGTSIVIGLIVLMVILASVALVVNFKVLPQLQKQKEEYTIKYLQQAELQMLPRPQDYIQRNGRKHPNLSKSKNRQSTTVQKIRTPRTDQTRDHSKGKQLLLQKPIDENSIYYKTDMPYLDYYSVANEGKQNMLLIIGDSHSIKLSYRFQQLYRDSVNNNKADSFPTIVSMIRYGPDTNEYHTDMMNFAVRFVKQHKPQKILFVNHWLNRWCIDREPFQLPANCNLQKLYDHNEYMLRYIRQFQQLGAEVSSIAVDIQHPSLEPGNMFDLNGVIQENIKLFKLSAFKNKYRQVIDVFENAMRNADVNIIDLSDNLCYNDSCQVLSPSGHGVYIDANHYSKFYSRHWISAVDHLTEF